MKFSRLLSKFFGSSRKSRCLEKGRCCHCPLVALMGVVWRSMALMGVVGRCGVVMIQGLQAPKRPCKLQRPRGPRRAGQTASTHSRVRAWIPQGKASNGIDIYWQATDAAMSAFRDDGECGEHGACGERGRIRGASVGSVAVVASVACVASVAVVASVLRGCMGRMGCTESLRIHLVPSYELHFSASIKKGQSPRKREEPLICNHSFLNKQSMVLLHM